MGATRNTGYLENLIQYDASDNVAIATSVNPSYKVTLGGSMLGTSAVFSLSSGIGMTIRGDWDRSATNNSQLYIQGNTNTNKQLRIGYDTTGNVGYIQALTSGTSVDKLLINPSGGNVGIGTPSPAYRLDVQNSSGFDTRLKATSLGGTVGLLFESNNDFSGTSQAYVKAILGGSNGQSTLIFGTATNVGDTTASEKMRITSGGNTVLGNNAGSGWSTGGGRTTLEIYGSIYPAAIHNSSSVGNAFTYNTYWDGANWRYVSASASVIYIQDSEGHKFLHNGAGTAGASFTPSERMRITSGGDVGVGVTTTGTNVKMKIKASSEGSGISLSSATFVIARSATDTQLGIGYYTTPDAWVISSTYGSDGAYKPIAFATSDTERMRITSGGQIQMGSNAPASTWTNLIFGSATTNQSYGVKIIAGSSSSDVAFQVKDKDDSGERFRIRGDGLIYTGTSGMSPYNYGVSGGVALYVGSAGQIGYNSSIRQSKNNIKQLDNVNWIHSLQPVTFNKRKKDNEGNYTEELESELQYGLIAEDVESVNPNFVFYNSDGKLAGVHYDRLVTPLIKAIQELKSENDSLKSRIEILENK